MKLVFFGGYGLAIFNLLLHSKKNELKLLFGQQSGLRVGWFGLGNVGDRDHTSVSSLIFSGFELAGVEKFVNCIIALSIATSLISF